MKKFSSIPKKLQYFALSLIFFIAAVLFIQILAQRRIANIRSAELQIGFIKANIETINALHHELLSSILYGKRDNPAILDKSDKFECGTDIIMHIAEDSSEFLEDHRCRFEHQ